MADPTGCGKCKNMQLNPITHTSLMIIDQLVENKDLMRARETSLPTTCGGQNGNNRRPGPIRKSMQPCTGSSVFIPQKLRSLLKTIFTVKFITMLL